MKKIKVWDLPTRIFHWVLVVSIIAVYITTSISDGDFPYWMGLDRKPICSF